MSVAVRNAIILPETYICPTPHGRWPVNHYRGMLGCQRSMIIKMVIGLTEGTAQTQHT